jgi:hypothetical protein
MDLTKLDRPSMRTDRPEASRLRLTAVLAAVAAAAVAIGMALPVPHNGQPPGQPLFASTTVPD